MLKPLWDEYKAAVRAQRDNRCMERDEKFRSSMAQSFTNYRKSFGALEFDPTREYDKLDREAGKKSLELRWDKPGFDKVVRLDKGVSGSGSGWTNPTEWNDYQCKYAIGLLPNELLQDINASIQASWFLGYGMQAKLRGLSWGGYVYGVDWGNVTYNTYIDDTVYVDSILGSNFLLTELATRIPSSQPKPDSSQKNLAEIKKSLADIGDALERAKAFMGERSDLIALKGGQMTIKSPDKPGLFAKKAEKQAYAAAMEELTPKAEQALADYQSIADDFKVAMGDFHAHLQEFRQNFPGKPTSALQQEAQRAFLEYRKGFIYNEMDDMNRRFASLVQTCQRFKLKRTGFMAIDQSLSEPPAWSAPSKELYSKQRVLSLLPNEMNAYVDTQRKWAFDMGVNAAEAEYQRIVAAQNAAQNQHQGTGYTGGSNGTSAQNEDQFFGTQGPTSGGGEEQFFGAQKPAEPSSKDW
jgi:hypothetical protein